MQKQTRTDALLNPQLFRDLNRHQIPAAAHEAILTGAVSMGHGVIRFGEWTFPATPAYLVEIFNLIDRRNQEQSRAQLRETLAAVRGPQGCNAEELLRISESFEIKAPVLNLLPFRFWITW
jgi:hypothetical protein